MSSGVGGAVRELEGGRGGAEEGVASDHTNLGQLQAQWTMLYLGCPGGRVSENDRGICEDHTPKFSPQKLSVGR
jgi:hypothetical protein